MSDEEFKKICRERRISLFIDSAEAPGLSFRFNTESDLQRYNELADKTLWGVRTEEEFESAFSELVDHIRHTATVPEPDPFWEKYREMKKAGKIKPF